MPNCFTVHVITTHLDTNRLNIGRHYELKSAIRGISYSLHLLILLPALVFIHLTNMYTPMFTPSNVPHLYEQYDGVI